MARRANLFCGEMALVFLLVALAASAEGSQVVADRPSAAVRQGRPPEVGVGGWMGAVRFYAGSPWWQWYSHVWSDKIAAVSCPFQGFDVYVGRTLDALQAAKDERRPASCGLVHFFNPHEEDCKVSLPPFAGTYVAIETPSTWLAKPSASACTVRVENHFSAWRPAVGLAGALLFLNADHLSHSLTFRLFAGSASFVLLSVLIVAFLVYRQLPSKRMLAVFTAAAASFPLLLQHLAAALLPSALDVTGNQIFLAYTALSALVGLAITYYYDTPGNFKMLNILAAVMKLLGLGLVYCQSPAAAISVPVAMTLVACQLARSLGFVTLKVPISFPPALTWKVFGKHEMEEAETLQRPVRPLGREEAQVADHSQQMTAEDGADLRPGRRASGRPIPADRMHGGSVSPPVYATPPSARRPRREEVQEESPLVKRGLILNAKSGRTIQIGKGTYNQLVLAGYVEDRINGTLTPPVRK